MVAIRDNGFGGGTCLLANLTPHTSHPQSPSLTDLINQLFFPMMPQNPVRATTSRFLSPRGFLCWKLLATVYTVFWSFFWPVEENIDDAHEFVTYWEWYMATICESHRRSRTHRSSVCTSQDLFFAEPWGATCIEFRH